MNKRGGPGRRPIPTAVHKLEGTFNVTRHRGRTFEPIAEGDLTEPPSDLTDNQQDIWRYAIQHAPSRVLKLIERDLLKAWVEAVDRHNTARLMQARSDTGRRWKLLLEGAPSPYLRIMDDATKYMLRCVQELGFSPAARPRLKVDAPDDQDDQPDDPWATLRVIPGGKTD